MIFIEYSLKKELYFLLYDYICAITDINLNTRRLLNILYNYFAQKQGFFLRRFWEEKSLNTLNLILII